MSVMLEIVLGVGSPAAEPTAANASFGELYERWFPRVVDLCRRTGCGDEEPEDVAQEAFAKAWAARAGYLENRPFWPWMAAIAKRACADRWRKQARDRVRQDWLEGRQQISVAQPDELAEEAEERELVARAFRQLRPVERRIVALQVIEGWTYNEIADFENVTVESVRSALHRARGTLRQAYLRTLEAKPIVALLFGGRAVRDAVGRAGRSLALRFGAEPLERAGIALLGAAAMAATIAVTSPPREPAPVGAKPAAPRPVGLGPAVSSSSAAVSVPEAAAGSEPLGRGTVATAPPEHGRSAAPENGGPSPIVTLPFDRADAPEDGYVEHFTTDRTGTTVFATGYASGGCDLPTCPAIFRSKDAGATWHRLPALGYAGGEVLLAPDYPANPRLFVAGTSSLQISDDDGASFEGVAPVGGSATISPAFSSGDPTILVGAAPGWRYRDNTGVVAPLTWGLVLGTIRSFDYSPGYPADPRVLVAGTNPSAAGGTNQSVILVCDQSACAHQALLHGASGPPSLTLSPSFATDGRAIAWRRGQPFRTTDGGLTFSPLAPPVDAVIQDVVFSGPRRVFVAMWGLDGQGHWSGGLFVSDDGGNHWTRLGEGTDLARGALTVVELPNGSLLAAPAAGDGGGVLCSVDGGRVWAARCAA